MRRLVGLFIVCLAAGCVTQSGAGGSEDRQRIQNILPFDLINCFPPKTEAPRPANDAILVGYWVAAQPYLRECLLDPASRGPEKKTTVTLTTTVSDSGVSHNVTGTNLTPQGQACIEASLKHLPTLAPLPKGKKAVSLSEPLSFDSDSNLAVVQGNEISNIAGLIRVSQKNWCDCYAPWSSAAPHLLTAKLTLKKGSDGKAVTDVAFEPSTAAGAAEVSSCMKTKLAALPYPLKSDEVSFGYTFRFLNSGANVEVPDEPANIQVMQMDGLRSARSEVTAFKNGARTNAALAYDALVKKYKVNSQSVTVKELKEKCQAMLKADETYAQAVQEQLGVEQKTLALIQQLGAQDQARWAKTTEAEQKAVDAARAELQSAKTARVNDEKACPRVGG